LASAAGSQGPAALTRPERHAYLFAGQSNIARLNDPAPGCGQALPANNVTLHNAQATPPVVGFCPVPAAPSEPLRHIMRELGDLHAPDAVDIILVAIESSALVEHNRQPGSEAWIDSVLPLNPTTMIHKLGASDPIFGPLLSLPSVFSMLQAADHLHVVWCQGETDCYPGSTISAPEYWLWAQLMFASIALQTGHASYDVHLVTLGSIDAPQQDHGLANEVRDGLFAIGHFPLGLTGVQPSITTVAHCFDLPHANNDAYHLTPCGYYTLAQRIADGIRYPALLPRVTGAPLLVIADQYLAIETNVPLATTAMDTVRNRFFDVFVNGQSTTSFATQAYGSFLWVHIPAGGLSAAQTIHVRHVAGSGHGRNWGVGVPPHGAPGGSRPLEPFAKSL
jgi:hypothetical protein